MHDPAFLLQSFEEGKLAEGRGRTAHGGPVDIDKVKAEAVILAMAAMLGPVTARSCRLHSPQETPAIQAPYKAPAQYPGLLAAHKAAESDATFQLEDT